MAATVPAPAPRPLPLAAVDALFAITDLPDAPPNVRRAVGAQLLYALGIRPRPTTTPQEGDQ